MNFNWRIILKILGGLLIIESLFLLSAFAVCKYYQESVGNSFLLSILIAFFLGTTMFFIGKNALPNISKREGSVIVTSVWFTFSIIGTIPFFHSGTIGSFTNAFFETMSGFTTTGASILTDIESLPKSMLYWRSLTQWIGGLGIIVISLALLPLFGFSGVQLFSSETPGPTKEKLHPRITETAKRLFGIYLFLTLTCVGFLKLGGMNWFDSICQTFSTVATGGFSTKQTSIAHWDNAFIQYAIILFMFLGGINFNLYYFGLIGKVKKVWKNEELRHYFYIILFASLFIFVSLLLTNIQHTDNFLQFEKTFRTALFHVTSILTTTGYATTDYMLWIPFAWITLLLLMFCGGCAGSTSGGIKIVRILIVFKYCYQEFKRMIHPHAVIPIRYNNEIVKNETIIRIMTFVLLYFAIIAIGCLFLASQGMDFVESVGGIVACLSGTGISISSIGPAESYAFVPDSCKWFLSFIMLVGRLELYTILLIFTPVFWKKQ